MRIAWSTLVIGLTCSAWLGCSSAASTERDFSGVPEDASTSQDGSGGSAGDAGADATGGTGGDASVGPEADAAPNPCQGMTCNAPPPNECENENELRTYNASGTCDAGTCSYGSQLVACPNGCDANACAGDPCIGVSCNTAPDSECADLSHLEVFDVPGQCADGVCSYGSHTVYCAFGCASGACEGDPCAGLPCNTPPVNFCSGADQLTVYDAAGTCSEGTCSYDSHDEFCQYGCTAGACEGDPCLGVTCNQPPADFCSSPTTLHEHQSTGTCADGNCDYHDVDVPCAYGCAGGICKECSVNTDCTGSNWCDNGTCKPCTVNAHCGASCTDCTVQGDVCNAASTGCVECNINTDCAASGQWCDANVCRVCNTATHCGASCGACAPTTPSCENLQCKCTGSSCGAYNVCSLGSCVFCDASSACGASCAPCPASTPYCLASGGTSSCVECTNDTHCTGGLVCMQATHTCGDPGCPPPLEACVNGTQNRDGCSKARVIGRPQAATSTGFKISDDTCSASNRFDDSSSCWDANADHTYRIYVRKGESVNITVDTGWDCPYDWSYWYVTLKIFTNAGCNATTCDNKVFCADQDDVQTTTYVATQDGWHIIVVDGSSAFDDEGDYDLTVKLTCNQVGCEC